MEQRTQVIPRSPNSHLIWCIIRSTILSLMVFVLLLLLQYPHSIAASNSVTPLRVGFILVGPTTDWGWNYAHNQARLYLEKVMPNRVLTTFAERIPENAEAERVMEKMIAQGNKLIFTTSYGFLEPAQRVASRHPDTTFVQTNRFSNRKNLSTITIFYDEPMYLAGLVAGRVTKTNILGFVGGHPVPPLLQVINAFALGARSVNPKVKVRVVWTNSWADPATEVEAAKGLIDTGVDVLASNLDTSLNVVKTAESRGVYSVSTHTDLHQFAPKGWLTGEYKDWRPLYSCIVRSIQNNSWRPASMSYTMKDGCTKLAPFGKAVPKSVQQEALLLKGRIEKGQFVVFHGPLKDRDGKERLTKGQQADAKWLANMDFFVAGVDGTLPKK